MDLESKLAPLVLSVFLTGCQTAPKIDSPSQKDIQLCQTLLNNAANSLNDVQRTHARAQKHYNSQEYSLALEELEYADNLYARSNDNIKIIDQEEMCGRLNMEVPYEEMTLTFDEFKKDIQDRTSYNSEQIAAVKGVRCAYEFSKVIPDLEGTRPLIDSANFSSTIGDVEGAISVRRGINGIYMETANKLEKIENDQDCIGISPSININQSPVSLEDFKKEVFQSWMVNGYRIKQLKSRLE